MAPGHYVCRSHDPTLGIWSTFVKKKLIFLPFCFSLLFFHLFFSSFLHPFCLRFFFNIISLRQLIVESCASPSNNSISLSIFDAGFQCKCIRTFFLSDSWYPSLIVSKAGYLLLRPLCIYVMRKPWAHHVLCRNFL